MSTPVMIVGAGQRHPGAPGARWGAALGRPYLCAAGRAQLDFFCQ